MLEAMDDVMTEIDNPLWDAETSSQAFDALGGLASLQLVN
jgi:hypothetical protein